MEIRHEIKSRAEELGESEANLDRDRRALHEIMREGRRRGMTVAELVDLTGYSPARVRQVAPASLVEESPDPEEDPGLVPETALPRLPDPSVEVLSGVESQRLLQPFDTPTVFLSLRSGRGFVFDSTKETQASGPMGLGDALMFAGSVASDLGVSSVRLFLTGAPEASGVEGVRAWAFSEIPKGWEVEGFYLHDPDLPILRFRYKSTGLRVRILRAAAWFGETEADPRACAHAWFRLQTVIRSVPKWRGMGLADTPSTTGRSLWLRTIPKDGGFPVLSREYRELIRSTSGQGRIELLPPARQTIPRFTYLDGRFMYAALTWGMGVGKPSVHRNVNRWAEQGDSQLRARGRWLVRVKIPKTWEHVGLLPARTLDGSWAYPRTPGLVFSTWADASEIHLAVEEGWSVMLLEGLTWKEGKPLNYWTEQLVTLWQAAPDTQEGTMVRAALRSLLLFGIGGFASASHNVSRACPIDSPEEVSERAIPGSVTRAGEMLLWEEPGELSSWSEAVAHPEWAAAVWGRARARLLGHGKHKGALDLRFRDVIAFSTDALYLAIDPEWKDSGAVGVFRSKGSIPGDEFWPMSRLALFKLRDAAEWFKGRGL